jgi:hypothetical protein
MTVSPDHGPPGTPVRVTAEGLPADTDFQLVWRTVKGGWKVKEAEYHGREYTPAAFEIATVKTDTSGRLAATFTVPGILASFTTSYCSRASAFSFRPASPSV